jgi:excisionase family DNA binding protein
MQPLLTAKDVASLLNIDLKKVQRLARTGVLTCVKVGAFYRFRQSALDAWISSHTQPARPVQTPRLVARQRVS